MRWSILVLTGIVFSFTVACNSDSDAAEDNEDDIIPEGYFKNPVFEPVFADPTVIKAGDGFFYAYATQDAWEYGEPDHLIAIIRSKDLVEWEFVGDAFTTKPIWEGKSNGLLWAPDIEKINDKYYLYYSLSIWDDPDPGIGVAISDTPAGPFTDNGKILLSQEVNVANSIDPFYYEEDGTRYLFWGSFQNIYGSELTDDGTSLTGEKFQIAGNWMEGTYIIKRDGFYYLFGSNGNCCQGRETKYNVRVARSANLKGPYVNKNGQDVINVQGDLLLEGNAEATGFVGPGHNAEIITDDEGTDWFIYHAIDIDKPYLPNDATRRPLMIDRIEWVEGWPKIENNRPNSEVQPQPVFNE